jgi:hypothetical protein
MAKRPNGQAEQGSAANGNGAAPPMSLRTYAKRRGVSAEAVSKAIQVGRLRECVVRVDGQPKIADPDLADREWSATTRPRIDHPIVSPGPVAPPAGHDRPADRATVDVGDALANIHVNRALREAALARKEAALADMAEIEVQVKRGQLVPVDEARVDVIDRFTVAKTKILGVATRVKQRMPHISGDDIRLIDDLLREALEELADAGGDGEATHVAAS